MPFNPSSILGYWVNKAAQAFQKHLDERVSEFGLRWTEAIVVLILYERPSALVEIAKALEHAHPSVLRQIDSLEEAGLVERSTHPEDRRVKIVALTEAGEQMALKLFDVAREIHEQATQGMDSEKTQALMIMLRDVIHNLGESDLLASFAREPSQWQTKADK